MEHIVIFLVGLLLFLVGAIFSMVAMALLVSSKSKIESCTAETVATVIRIEKRTRSRHSGSVSSTSWYPTFEYYVNGRKIIKESNFGSPEQTFYVGQKVALHYNPVDINEYYVQEQKVSTIAKIFMLLGIVLLLCAAVAMMVFVVVSRRI